MMMRVVLALACLVSCCQSVVIGVDIGAEFMKVALVKPGTPFSIVTNLESKRKTEVMLGFNEGERVFSGGAINLFSRKPLLTFHNMRLMMGRTIDHPRVKDIIEKAYFPIDLVANETTSRIAMVHKDKATDTDATYSIEMIMAMILQYAKDITKAYGEGVKVRDVVFTVPSFWTQNEKQSLLDAASLVGFKVLALIDENTAAAVQYGIDRTYENTTHNVLYYNMGSNSVQVSIAQYGSRVIKSMGKNKTISTFKILGKGSDESVGGGHFDLKLANFVADAFDNSKKRVGKPGVRTLKRPISKIKLAVVKTKRVLSANKQTAVNIAGLADDIDFNVPITREKFEEMSADLFEKVLPPIEEALAAAKMTKEDIDSVEILGGGVRIPKVKALLKEFFGDMELGVHLNGDEAFALGAAFVAANKSATFRVRSVGMQDISRYSIGVRLQDVEPVLSETETAAAAKACEGVDEGAKCQFDNDAEAVVNGTCVDKACKPKVWTKPNVKVFAKNNKLNSNKLVAFGHSKDFTVSFQYNASEVPAGTPTAISVYKVSGVEEFAKSMVEKNLTGLTGKPKVQLSFKLDLSGMVHLVKAEATQVQIVPPKIEEEEDVESDGNATDTNATNATDAEGEKKGDAEEEVDAANATNASNTTNGTNATKAAKEPAKPTKKTHRVVLTVTRTDEGVAFKKMGADEKQDIIDALREMDRQDDLRKERAAAKNNLESFMYESKDKLSTHEEDVSQVTTEEQVTAIKAELEETDDWLYGDGENLPSEDYVAKQRELKKKVDAIFSRVSEFVERPKAVAKVRKEVNETYVKLGKWETSKPQVTAMEREEVLNITTKLSAWLEEKVEAQEKLESHEEPAFKAKDALIKMKPLKALLSRLSKRPKPVPKPKPKVKSNATNTTNSSNATDANVTETEEEEKAEDGEKKEEDAEKKGEESKESEKEDDSSDKEEEKEEL